MKDKTIDYVLRATWQAVSRMYNEEAAKYGATMATGFALLSMDKDKGTPSTSLGLAEGPIAIAQPGKIESHNTKTIARERPADIANHTQVLGTGETVREQRKVLWFTVSRQIEPGA